MYGPGDASLDDAGPDRWRSVYLDRWTGGDSYVTLPDPTDERFVYYEHQNGAMMRMDITGASVLTGGPSSQNIRPRLPSGSPALRFSWYTPFFISPHNPRTLYAGGNRVLKSTDRGTTWKMVSTNLADSADGDRAVVPTGALTMLTESSLVPGMLAGGTGGGGVWLTVEAGAHWGRIATWFPRKWVSRVTFSTKDASVLYVSFTGYRQNDNRPYLYASADTGRTWRSIAANLPQYSVNVIKEDPTNADLLYVGTDIGVYVSSDRGKSWESLSATLPSTPVQDLTVQSRDAELVIGTYGRGAWVLDLIPIRHADSARAGGALFMHPPRDVTADYFPWESVPGDRRGRSVALVQVVSSDDRAATVTVTDSAGRVVRRWSAPLIKGVTTLTWDLQATLRSGALGDALAGSYKIEVEAGALRTSRALRVLPDPVGAQPRR